jgi:hypothetical protein
MLVHADSNVVRTLPSMFTRLHKVSCFVEAYVMAYYWKLFFRFKLKNKIYQDHATHCERDAE